MALHQLLYNIVQREKELQVPILQDDVAGTPARLPDGNGSRDEAPLRREAGCIGAINPARVVVPKQLSLHGQSSSEKHEASALSLTHLQQHVWRQSSQTKLSISVTKKNKDWVLEEMAFRLIKRFLCSSFASSARNYGSYPLRHPRIAALPLFV